MIHLSSQGHILGAHRPALIQRRLREWILPDEAGPPAFLIPKQIDRLLVQRVEIPTGANRILVGHHGRCSLPTSSPVAFRPRAAGCCPRQDQRWVWRPLWCVQSASLNGTAPAYR